MLSAIVNASRVRKGFLEIPYSKICEQIAKVMQENGFLAGVNVFKEKDASHKKIRLALAYDDEKVGVVESIRRVSSPGRRMYEKSHSLRRVAGGYGLMIVSTPRGIMSGEEARKRKLGGEILCEVR